MENKQIAAKFNPSEGVESLYKCFELVRQDEREKMTQLPNDAGFMTWFEKYFYKQPSENPLIWTSKSSGRIYSAKQLVSMYNRAMKEAT